MQTILNNDKYKEHIPSMVALIFEWFNETDDLIEVFWNFHNDELYLVQIVNIAVKSNGLSWIKFPPSTRLKVGRSIEQMSKSDFDNLIFKNITKDSKVLLSMFHQCDRGNLLSLLDKEGLVRFILNPENFKGSMI